MAEPDVSLCGYLRGVCDRAMISLPPGAHRDAIAVVRNRLARDVLRVAVGGRLNAGKSTLVNALLGESLAATDATECTTLVTWFTYGAVNKVKLSFRDGTSVTLPPQPLSAAVIAAGRPAADVSVAEVQCSSSVLARQYTVVDTPGLDALSGLDAMSLEALADADVLLYVMPHPGENDRDALKSLRATSGEADITAITAIGVLSRIDQLGQGIDDPWPEARRIAANYARSPGFTALLGDVIPVLGLLAQTALGTDFTEADMGPLRDLAEADQSVLDLALYSADDFREHPGLPITAQARERLLSLLGMHGIAIAISEIRRGTRGAPKLLAALREHSGIAALLDQLSTKFVRISDPLRARPAIDALEAVTWQAAGSAEAKILAAVRDELDAIRSDARLRQLGLAASLSDLNAGRWVVSEQGEADLVALATGADLAAQLGADPAVRPSELRKLLSDRITSWRVLENTATRTTARHARAVREYLESLFFSLPPDDPR